VSNVRHEAGQVAGTSLPVVLAQVEEAGLALRETVAFDRCCPCMSPTQQRRRLVAKIGLLIEARYKATELAVGADLIDERTAPWTGCWRHLPLRRYLARTQAYFNSPVLPRNTR